MKISRTPAGTEPRRREQDRRLLGASRAVARRALVRVSATILAGSLGWFYPDLASGQTRGRPSDTTRVARELPGILAQASRGDCASRDDPRARGVWERLRSKYADGADSLSVWAAELSTSSGYVANPEFLRFDTAVSTRLDGTTSGWNTQEIRRDGDHRLIQFSIAPRVGRGSRGMGGTYRAQLSREIATNGYARILPGVNADLTQTWAAWAYPPLEAELATHFVSADFGRLSALSMSTSDGGFALAFCSRSQYRSKPYLSGVMVLRADTTVERVYWRFHTPAPDEAAGGQAEFPRYDPSNGLPLLLPSRGTYFRRQGVAFFYQRQQTFPRWWTGPWFELPAQLVAEPETTNVKPVVIFKTATDSTGVH